MTEEQEHAIREAAAAYEAERLRFEVLNAANTAGLSHEAAVKLRQDWAVSQVKLSALYAAMRKAQGWTA